MRSNKYQISLREHLVDSARDVHSVDLNTRSLVVVYIREWFGNQSTSRLNSSQLMELEERTLLVVKQITSWRSEKQQRQKATKELTDIISSFMFVPKELLSPGCLVLLDALTPIAIEAAYGAFLKHRNYRLAQQSVFMMLLILESPYWLRDKFDSGELTYPGENMASEKSKVTAKKVKPKEKAIAKRKAISKKKAGVKKAKPKKKTGATKKR